MPQKLPTSILLAGRGSMCCFGVPRADAVLLYPLLLIFVTVLS